VTLILLVVFLALLIPIAAIVLDSPVVRSFVLRGRGEDIVPPDVKELADKVSLLESDLDELKGEIKRLAEGQEFQRHLLEKRQDEPARLPKPKE
jgi:hypothetical protein